MILPVLASILIAFFLSRYIVNNDANSNGRQNYQEKRRASNPNYDEYIDQASVNGWIPIDPVDKFVDVIEPYEATDGVSPRVIKTIIENSKGMYGGLETPNKAFGVLAKHL